MVQDKSQLLPLTSTRMTPTLKSTVTNFKQCESFEYQLDYMKEEVPEDVRKVQGGPSNNSKVRESPQTSFEWALDTIMKRKAEYGYFYPLLLELAEINPSAPITNAWPETGAS